MNAVTGEAKRPIVIAAGGTGGHLFPAQALAHELQARGHEVHLMTDQRVNRHMAAFPAIAVHEIPSATFGLRRFWRVPLALLRLYRGYRKARAIMAERNVAAVIGFGGYPSLPPLVAAVRLGVATCIHEQNAVLGRANRLLGGRVNAIAGSFPDPKHLAPDWQGKYHLTGNPVRPNAKRFAATGYEHPGADEPVRIVIFGGSQGARVMSEVVPHAIRGSAHKHRLQIVQQCREEDLEAVRAVYSEHNVGAEVASFFDDLPERIARSHLVVCRAGASTIGELSVIGRSAILVPLPHSLDQDQRENALRFVNAGGGWLMDQETFTAELLAAKIDAILDDPHALTLHSEAALAFGWPDAEQHLADVVEEIIARH